MRPRLTKKQAAILAWITGFIRKNGYAPSTIEISEQFGLWRNGVAQHLWLIERKGYIKRVPHVARGLVLPASGQETTDEQCRASGEPLA